MNWFYNLRVGVKLVAGFVIVALVAGLIGLVGILNSRSISSVWLMAILVIFDVALALGLGLFSTKEIAEPLNLIGRAAEKAASGDLSVNVEIRRSNRRGWPADQVFQRDDRQLAGDDRQDNCRGE